MTELPSTISSVPAQGALPAYASVAAGQGTCDECLGSGGWFRYEPALEPAPGMLYLSCLHCRGTGRTAEPRGA